MPFFKASLSIFLIIPALLSGALGHPKVVERAPGPTQTSAPLNRVKERQAAVSPVAGSFLFIDPFIYQPLNSGDSSWLFIKAIDTATFAATTGAMTVYCNVSIPTITFSSGLDSWNIDWPQGSNIQGCGVPTFGIAISMEGANTVITLQHTITDPTVGTIVRTAKHAYQDYHKWTLLSPLDGGPGLITPGTYSEPYTQAPAPAGWVGDYLQPSTLAYINSTTYTARSFVPLSKRKTSPTSINLMERRAAAAATPSTRASPQALATPVLMSLMKRQTAGAATPSTKASPQNQATPVLMSLMKRQTAGAATPSTGTSPQNLIPMSLMKRQTAPAFTTDTIGTTITVSSQGTAASAASISATIVPPQAAATVSINDSTHFRFSNPMLHLPTNSGNPTWFSIGFTDSGSFAVNAWGISAYCNVSISSIKFFNSSSPDWDVTWPAGTNLQVCGNPTMGMAVGMDGANVAVTLQHTVTGYDGQTNVRTAKHDFAAVHTWNHVESEYGNVLMLNVVDSEPWTAVPAPAGWVGDKLLP